MKLSHSKLNSILSCPMSYYLGYECKISKKEEKLPFLIGGAVHYGVEHETTDLSEYFKENGTFNQSSGYSYEQLLSESMVYGFLKHKEHIYDEMLTKNGKKLEVLDIQKELNISGKLKSNVAECGYHDFVGIIDLLLLTNEGFIIVDYKTSSMKPNFDDYLEQIYRYIFLLRDVFPDVPIAKIAIINIRKSKIRQKKTENESQFLNRLKFEYELNDEDYVNYHEYEPEKLDEKIISDYISNLSVMADSAQTLLDNKLYYTNFANAKGQYGKSDYWDILYHSEDAHVLYKIKDKIVNDDFFDDDLCVNHDSLKTIKSIKSMSDEEITKTLFKEYRDCIDIDMMSTDLNLKLMNNYSKFKEYFESLEDIEDDYELYDKLGSDGYVFSEQLIKEYLKVYHVEHFLKKIN